ncbi:MAG: sporulation transcriptional regulator SpoIIID [Clostridia bacterium]|nr:sporulation transcriptional regulator SpoIIID [Clostridia bacterium]
MREYIENRTVRLAEYIVENKSTVRSAAKKFGISKSTVHKDVSERLKEIDRGLFDDVRIILDENKEVRHIRGGLATRKKYSEKRKNSIVKDKVL